VSPDGRSIAFIWFEGEGDHPALATMTLSDGVPDQLTAPSIAAASPEWSPDGRQIAYVRVLPGSDSLWITDADGSTDRRVPIGDFVEVRSPTWSPDGEAIAFAGSREGEGGSLESDIYTFDFRSEQLDQVSKTPDIDEDETAWSPDGSVIAFTTTERDSGAGPSRPSVWTMTREGRNQTLVAGGERSYSNPAWAPDGSSMLISDGDWIYRVDLPNQSGNGQITQLVEGTAAVWQPHVVGSVVPPLPSPTLAPDQEGRDIGLGFRVCFDGFNDPMGGIDFLGDGTPGRAWIGVPVKEDGTCPVQARPRADIIAIDYTGDRLADTWLDLGVRCDVLCAPHDATDLDGNGTEELVVASHFSIMDYFFFSLGPDQTGDLALQPIRVAAPGHEPADILAGERLMISAGGDAGYGSSIACENYPSAPVIVWSWSSGPVEGNDPREVHVTRIQLQADGLFHVIGTNDYTVPGGQPSGLDLLTAPACRVDWHPNA
jgi:hypothetical protein